MAGMFAAIGGRIEQIVRTIRGPEQSRIATVNGVPHYGSQVDGSQSQRLLESWGIFTARVSPEAGPSRDRWSIWPADNLTPERIIDAQRQAVTSGNPQIWVEMIDQCYSRDGHYASCTDQRVADVLKGTWRLDPWGSDPLSFAIANFVENAYRSTARWTDGLGWLLYSNLFAYNGVEVEWHEAARSLSFPGIKGETITANGLALPRQLYNTHPKHFRFDQESDDPLFWIGPGYEPLPLGKFIFMDSTIGLAPIKVRRGHAWQCLWYSMFRSISWSSWATRVERFDMPIPMMGYEGELAQYDEYKQAMLDIDASLGSGKGIRYPKNAMDLKIESPPGGGTAHDPQSALSDACDAAQSIRVLGGQLNNKIGNVGSFAASSNHIDIKYGLEELDARRAWERIDEQFTRPLLLFNAVALADALRAAGYADATPEAVAMRVPRGKHHIPGKSDPEMEMRVITAAVKLGMPISMSGTFAQMDFQRARNDADRIPGEAQSVDKGAALKTPADAAAGNADNPDDAALIKAKADAAVVENALPAKSPTSKPADGSGQG